MTVGLFVALLVFNGLLVRLVALVPFTGTESLYAELSRNERTGALHERLCLCESRDNNQCVVSKMLFVVLTCGDSHSHHYRIVGDDATVRNASRELCIRLCRAGEPDRWLERWTCIPLRTTERTVDGAYISSSHDTIMEFH